MTSPINAVLSGSLHRDIEGLGGAWDLLTAAGFQILSPKSIKPIDEAEGFVRLAGDHGSPAEIEERHLLAIERAHFLWVHSEDGYIGPSVALEIGHARGAGVPVFSLTRCADPAFVRSVEVVQSVDEVPRRLRLSPSPRALAPLQRWYKEVSVERGYDSEDDRDALLNAMEELGELAREGADLPRQEATRQPHCCARPRACRFADDPASHRQQAQRRHLGSDPEEDSHMVNPKRTWEWDEVIIPLVLVILFGVVGYFALKIPDGYDRERKELWELSR